MVNCGMFTKYKIEGINGFAFGEDKKLYKLAYEKDKRGYSVREIKEQYPNRYKINGVWWSKRQLRPLLYLDTKPIKLFELENLPF